MRDIKDQLQKNIISIGTWLTIGDSAVAEIMCQSGFDWITIDMEHSAITLSEAQEAIRTIDLCDVVPIVRVGNNDPYLIKRVLDAGAKVIIVPMVNTKEEAIAAVKAIKYPPLGTRGVGLARAQKYGFGFEEYKEWVNEKSSLVVQIEHIDAVNNLEEILSVPGVDASFIGPYDLSGSLGRPGDFEFPEFKNAIARYEKISKRLNKPMGYHVVQPDTAKVEELIAKGYVFIAVGVDSIFLGSRCREVMSGLSKVR